MEILSCAQNDERSRLLQQRAVFGLGFGVFGGDDDGGGYFVIGVEVEELDAGGGAAGGADGFGVDADDFAELADEHHFGGVVDQVDGGDFADLGSGLHGDDALAAAGLEAVGVDRGALAEAVLADGEDEAGGEADFFVELGELGGGFGGDFGLVGAQDFLPIRSGGAGGDVGECGGLSTAACSTPTGKSARRGPRSGLRSR